ncbi:hypothetical protein NE237_001602 [Protea cynaroides]|uniref:Uncharacterized protein n=1 Tax=Protea cynaroides TaxID=273540 RepID=A0A9Q0KTN7_9MAGN|nr:hypothetical protein NE237_001602 [Protea cynaroides]
MPWSTDQYNRQQDGQWGTLRRSKPLFLGPSGASLSARHISSARVGFKGSNLIVTRYGTFATAGGRESKTLQQLDDQKLKNIAQPIVRGSKTLQQHGGQEIRNIGKELVIKNWKHSGNLMVTVGNLLRQLDGSRIGNIATTDDYGLKTLRMRWSRIGNIATTRLETLQQPDGQDLATLQQPDGHELETLQQPGGQELETLQQPDGHELETLQQPGGQELETLQQPSDQEWKTLQQPDGHELEILQQPGDQELETLQQPDGHGLKTLQQPSGQELETLRQTRWSRIENIATT